MIFWISGFLVFWDAATRFFIVLESRIFSGIRWHRRQAQVKIRFPVRNMSEEFLYRVISRFSTGKYPELPGKPRILGDSGVFSGFWRRCFSATFLF